MIRQRLKPPVKKHAEARSRNGDFGHRNPPAEAGGNEAKLDAEAPTTANLKTNRYCHRLQPVVGGPHPNAASRLQPASIQTPSGMIRQWLKPPVKKNAEARSKNGGFGLPQPTG